MKKKFKHQPKYLPYLNNVYSYLASFIKRSRPLFDLDSLEKNVHSLFEERYVQGKIAGWDDNEPIN
jgi:splicing factor 3A subunit 3